MKKTINVILILFLICCFSCKDTIKEIKSQDRMNGKPILTIVFDSCQYVGFKSGDGYHYTHKGNCIFCIKRNKNK